MSDDRVSWRWSRPALCCVLAIEVTVWATRARQCAPARAWQARRRPRPPPSFVGTIGPGFAAGEHAVGKPTIVNFGSASNSPRARSFPPRWSRDVVGVSETAHIRGVLIHSRARAGGVG